MHSKFAAVKVTAFVVSDFCIVRDFDCRRSYITPQSLATVCHGRSDTSDSIIGTNRFCLSGTIVTLICLIGRGHQTYRFARFLHFVIPWCHSWIFPRIVFCMATGITKRLHLSSNHFWMVRPASTCRYTFSPDSRFALFGHQCMQNYWMF